MSNPFRDWTLAKVQAHNSRVGKLPPKIETAASLLASMRERETKKKTQALADANAKASHLEIKFMDLWKLEGGPELDAEFRFHPERKWRFDFAHQPSKTAIEIEGGVWNGRHTRGGGFQSDAEKYFEAHIRGWRVVRLTPNLITRENLRALAMRMSL
jgi:very-short-patch-repair endonuclease